METYRHTQTYKDTCIHINTQTHTGINRHLDTHTGIYGQTQTHTETVCITYYSSGTLQFVCGVLSILGRGRKVAGTILNVGAGDPSLRPVRNGNSGNPLKVD